MRSSLIDKPDKPVHQKDQASPYPLNNVPPQSSSRLARESSQDHGRDSLEQREHWFMPREGWLSLLLLAIALYCVVYAVVAAHWVDGSASLYWSPLLGLLIGFLVARSSYVPQTLLHLLSCAIGYLFSIWVTSVQAFHVPPLAVIHYLFSAFTGQFSAQSPDASQLVFFFYLSFLCFFLGYFGSWLIYRASLPWLVAFVYCSIMLVDLNYVSVSMSYLNYFVVIMVGALLLLIARVQLTTQVMRWVNDGLYTDRIWLRKITMRCMQAACLVTILALPLSYFLPTFSQPDSGKIFWDRLDNAWGSLLDGHFTLDDLRALGTLNGTATNYFGNHLLVSNSVNLPNGDVLSYQSSDHQSHYLESVSYDQFDGQNWSINSAQTTPQYNAYAPLPPDIAAQGNQIATTVKILHAIDGSSYYLFAPAMPTSFSLPTKVTAIGSQDLGMSSTTSWSTDAPLQVNGTYSVTSQLPVARTQELDAVPLPQENPSYWLSNPYYYWLNTMYMQLPSDLSPTVTKTVDQWTQGTNTTFEALKQIEAHLSDPTVFTYSTTNLPIPDKTDVADWLLQTKSGYCTYYATAMVVMGRLLHIPMRLMSGFSAGVYDENSKSWVVQGSDAHSWVQAYFPGFGWIDFDPTPGYNQHSKTTAQSTPTAKAVQPTPIVKPTQAAKPTKVAQPQSTPATGNQSGHGTSYTVSPLLFWGAGGLFSLALAGGGLTILTRSRRRRHELSTVALSSLYLQVCRLARWAGLGPRSWQTPYEYSEMLSLHMKRRDPLLWRLTDQFVRERWGAPDQNLQELNAQDVAQRWPSLRSSLLLLFFRKCELRLPLKGRKTVVSLPHRDKA
jgi:transglutaminase-like putative cysteine protease